MGLTGQSHDMPKKELSFKKNTPKADFVVALAGNPNTGKSTVFNSLTGLNQHTGNWPGKTVLRAEGRYINRGMIFKLVDLPGTYSLSANSLEEQIARDYLCFAKPHATVVVVDATCLERNLNLVLQVLEITPRVVVCINLVDEARRKKIHIDIEKLAVELGVPVVATAARDGYGLDKLVSAVADVAAGCIKTSPCSVKYGKPVEEAILIIEPQIKKLVGEEFNSRWLALRLLERDQTVINAVEQWLANQPLTENGSADTVAGGEI